MPAKASKVCFFFCSSCFSLKKFPADRPAVRADTLLIVSAVGADRPIIAYFHPTTVRIFFKNYCPNRHFFLPNGKKRQKNTPTVVQTAGEANLFFSKFFHGFAAFFCRVFGLFDFARGGRGSQRQRRRHTKAIKKAGFSPADPPDDILRADQSVLHCRLR